VVFHIAFAARFANPMMQLKKIFSSGFFGKILGINAANPGNAHVPDYPDWTRDPRYSGGGAIMDHTVHCADLMRWFLSAEITEVYAEAAGRIRKWGVEDAAEISVMFDNGIFATIEASWVRQPHNPEIFGFTFDIFGTEAVVSTRHWYSEKIVLRQEIPDIHTDIEGDGCGRLQLDPAGYYGGEYDRGILGEFHKAITGKPHMGADIYDGVRADQVCDAAYRSILEKNPVSIGKI
jgi:predicted dehydrogenase